MAEPSARSGVRGLSPFQVRFQLGKNGWAALPIVRHDAADKGAGKRPVLTRWEAFAKYGAAVPTSADLNEWESRFGHAPGTGLAMGNEVAIDLDFRDPILAKRAYDITVAICGETPFVRQGQAPKIALVYRAAEPIATIRLKAADGSGDGLDVLGDGAQLVAFGIHPNTLEPYRWVGAATPLTATPDDAPAITNAQIRGVLTELGRFVELTSGRGPAVAGSGSKSRGRGGFGTIVRNAEGLVVDGREAWLTLTVRRIAGEMHAEGAVDVGALASRSWAAFEATTTLADGRWIPREARQKAEALVRRVKAGTIDLGGLKPAEPRWGEFCDTAEPSYPDDRRPLAEAEKAVVEVVGRFFGEHVPAWKQAVQRASEAEAFGHAVPMPMLVSWGVRVETAIGKTAVAIKAAAKAVQAGAKVVYAVPRHDLAAELVERSRRPASRRVSIAATRPTIPTATSTDAAPRCASTSPP